MLACGAVRLARESSFHCGNGVIGLRAVRTAALRHVGTAAALGAASCLNRLRHKLSGVEALGEVFGDPDNDGGLAFGRRDEHRDA